jgi:hypothetical protein
MPTTTTWKGAQATLLLRIRRTLLRAVRRLKAQTEAQTEAQSAAHGNR